MRLDERCWRWATVPDNDTFSHQIAASCTNVILDGPANRLTEVITKARLCYVLGIAAEAILALYPVIISAFGKVIAGFDLLEQITRMEVSIGASQSAFRAVR